MNGRTYGQGGGHRRRNARAAGGRLARAVAGQVERLEARVLMAASDVVINEIMYNSATFETADEYVELYNKGGTPVTLTGWKLASGVDFTFGSRTIGAGQYLVVAANLARFAQKYPSVTNVVGNWTGGLSNSSNTIRLLDQVGQEIDEVAYADDGDWAVRRRGGLDAIKVANITRSGSTATVTVANHGVTSSNRVAIFGANQSEYDGIFTPVSINAAGFTITVSGSPATPATGQIYVRRDDRRHFGWDWFNLADGGGRSLELVNANLRNDRGQNWAPSVGDNGTPGAANSVASSNLAPMVLGTEHGPRVPRSTDPVTVTARLLDENPTNTLTAALFYRNAGTTNVAFTQVAMLDDGLHGDGGANDGLFGAAVPPQANNTVIEYYVRATDNTGKSRTWPAPTDVTGAQGANALYQVDDSAYSGSQPLFKIVMSPGELAEYNAARASTTESASNAKYNATFVSLDGNGSDVRYLTGVRNRGGGSRRLSSAAVGNYQVDFGDANPWHNVAQINLNGIYAANEVLASALLSRARIQGQWATPVQVRTNNIDYATNGSGLGMFGSYSWVEAEDNDMVGSHFPLDDQGNYYRGVDDDHNAGLQYEGTNAATYAARYPKQTNVEANDYADLINLFKALDPVQTPNANFQAAVSAVADVRQWMRYFAVNVLLGNGETSLGTGSGDDFALYRGVADPRFELVAHDMDTVLNIGDTIVPPNRSIFVATNVASVKRLMDWPAFRTIYFEEMRDLVDNVYTPGELSRVIRHAIGSYAPESVVNFAIADAVSRRSYAISQLPAPAPVAPPPPQGANPAPPATGVRINEVMADAGSGLPDLIELFNAGPGTVDLSDFGISDDPLAPRKFVFPAGTTLAAGEYLVVNADGAGEPGIHLGFSLSASGEGVYLSDTPSAGGGLVDSVEFGVQLEGMSVGRVGAAGGWTLTTPTFGSENAAVALGNPATLKINEWQAAGVAPFGDDFIELYNPDSNPVDLGGLSITDRFIGDPARHAIAALSFVRGSGLVALTADGDTGAGADHLNFRLDHDRGEIALLDAAHETIDWVFYAGQRAGVSEGASPDGSADYVFFNQPTPGISNPNNVNQTVALNLILKNSVWRYNQEAQFNTQNWIASGYDDSGWQSGPALIYHESSTLPWAKNTALEDAAHPYNGARRTYYFRTTFTLSDPASITSLRLSALIDDGAVFYLNGQEIKRVRMDDGTVTYNTLANENVTNATSVDGEFPILPGFLVAGTNVLAVEVHQNFDGGTTSSDLVFGATLDATRVIVAPPGPPLRVTEIAYNPPGSVDTPGDEHEFIEFQNVGPTPLNLGGYHFGASVEFTFPNVTLAPGAKTVVVKNATAFRARYGNAVPIAGEYQGSLDNRGEVIRLETPGGLTVQEFAYADAWYPTTDGAGDTLVINDANADVSTWGSSSSWHASSAVLGTPGIDETLARGVVVVNEASSNSDGPNDWIELKNTTGAPVDVSGWYLSDSAGGLLKYRIPANTVIPAFGFVTFQQYQAFGGPGEAQGFALSSGGDDVYLTQSSIAGISGGYRDGANFEATDAGVPMGRHATSDGRTVFVALSRPTPGAQNAYPLVGPVVINEVMYRPGGAGGDEFIEIKNISSSTVNLYEGGNVANTWRFTSGVDFVFPAGLSLAPGERMIIVPSSILPAAFRLKYGIPLLTQIVGGYGGALSNGGERVTLSKPGAPLADLTVPLVRVDSVEYGTDGAWPSAPDGNGPSLERFVEYHFGDDPANWRASNDNGGSPGAANPASPVTASGEFARLAQHKLVFKFDKNVSASLSTADLELVNLTTGATIPTGAIALAYDTNSNIATFTFPGLANQRLGSGRYRARLDASGVGDGVAQLDGNADGYPGDDAYYDFVHLPGDMNGDAAVNFTDFQQFETRMGKTGATWADGDFNYDGVVSRADFMILNANYGTTLAPPPPVPAAPAPPPAPAPGTGPAPTPPVVAPPATRPPSRRPAAKAAAVTTPPAPAPVFGVTRIVKRKDASAVWE